MGNRYIQAWWAATAIALAATFATSAVTGISAQAAGSKLAKSQAGYYRFMLGDTEVISLSDGTVPLDTKYLVTDHRDRVDALVAKSFEKSPLDASVNAYLIKFPDKLVLVDAGTAELYGPSLFKLPESLHNVGYTPEQITDIFITHIHTDHTGGLMDGTRRVFPNAVVHVERKEVEYWMDPASKQRAPDYQKVYFDQAAAKFKPYLDSGQVKTFDGAVELLPGFRSIPAPGHTPGHTFYSLERNGEKLVFWGDILHVAEVQLPDPTVTITFDVDPRQAAEQRKRAFADAAEKGYWVAPAHISFPGFGHVRRVNADGEEYRWYPAPYVNDAPYASH